METHICMENVYVPHHEDDFVDYIRGSISLAIACKKYNIKCFLNYSHHNMSSYVKNMYEMTEADLNQITSFGTNDDTSLEQYVSSIYKQYGTYHATVPVSSKVSFLLKDLDESICNLIRESLIPTSELESILRKYTKDKEYNLIYISSENELFNNITDVIPTDHCVFYSDNKKVNECLLKKGFTVCDENSIVTFFVMLRAKKIIRLFVLEYINTSSGNLLNVAALINNISDQKYYMSSNKQFIQFNIHNKNILYKNNMIFIPTTSSDYSIDILYDRTLKIPIVANKSIVMDGTTPMIGSIFVCEYVFAVLSSMGLNITQPVWITDPYDAFAQCIRPSFQDRIKEDVHFVSFASNNMKQTLERVKLQAETCGFFKTVTTYKEEDIPEFLEEHSVFLQNNPRLFGYAIWKPYIIQKKLETLKDGEFLFYSDAGNTINPFAFKRFQEYVDICKSSQYKNVCFQHESQSDGLFQEKNWTKEDVLSFFSLTDSQRRSAQIWDGGWLLQASSFTRRIVKLWVDQISNYSLWDDSPSKLPNAKTFAEHRHDQSILSCILKTHGSHFIEENETMFQHSFPIWATRLRYL